MLFKKEEKKTNKKKRIKYFEKKKNSLKNDEVRLVDPLFNFEGVPRVSLLNLRGVPGPTIKL